MGLLAPMFAFFLAVLIPSHSGLVINFVFRGAELHGLDRCFKGS